MKKESLNSSVIIDFKLPGGQKLLDKDHAVSSWQGFKLEYSALPLPAGYNFKEGDSNRHFLAYHDMMFNEGEMQITGAPLVELGDIRGKMTYFPLGTQFNGWAIPKDRKNSFTTLSFSPELIGQEIETLYAKEDRTPFIHFEHCPLKSTMLKLQNILKSDFAQSSLYLETLGLVAVLETSQALASKISGTVLHRGGLTKSQKKFVAEYIQSKISTDITLNELAALVGMSRFHFSRSFKESFGDTPVRYINRERLMLAQALLAGTRISIHEIAENTGFGSVQHFIKVFKDVVGVTPTDYRKQS